MRNRWLKVLVGAAAVPALALCLSVRGAADEAAPLAKEATRHAKVYLGIGVEPAAAGADQAGVVVREVTPDSPAAKGGLKPGDVIVKVGDRDVKDFGALAGAVSSHKAGDKVAVHVRRDGKEQDLTVTLAERQVARFPKAPESFPERRGAFLGVQTQDITPELKDRLGLAVDKGALVTNVIPGTPAAKAGLKDEDVITAVNGQAVANSRELREAIHKAGTGKDVTVKGMRGNDKMEVKARLEESPLASTSFWGANPGPRMWSERLPVEMAPFFGSDARVKELEKRVQDLEKQVHDLQQKLNQPKK
jgi:S1-C subfamily serine protease